MFENKCILTGVKPTGKPHIGNYFGAILPALKMGNTAQRFNLFIADYHAINFMKNAEMLQQEIKEIACIYLAAGLDPQKHYFYRQSDIPEINEITTILYAFTPKGLMNKSHAYKAAVDKNTEAGKPTDDGINMGLYTYPTLMAADILAMDTDIVPVGKDQIQHVEIARDIAGAVNAYYDKELLKLPEYYAAENVAVVPGIDGRKMSKSYNNVIPLCEDEKVIKKAVYATITDSRPMDEPKDPESVIVYQIYKCMASPEKIAEMAAGLQEGKLGYGHVKAMLLDEILAQTKEVRERYDYYISHYDEVKGALEDGAAKARPFAQRTLARLKETLFGK
ncbi:MAG: tryptophan--tRNA ligase [Alphaproteobacteria bacterium]|nr:tryptophan--tRNA ligase [Alphaproteobacteria bacterium]